jgi:hypothetical protein
MFTLLRGVLLFIPVSLAIFAVPERTEAHPIAGSSTKGDLTVDLSSGSLKIPNAALEPVKWSDLDGWAGDDHASAFATFYASCRPIIRSSALRAEAASESSFRRLMIAQDTGSAIVGPARADLYFGARGSRQNGRSDPTIRSVRHVDAA